MKGFISKILHPAQVLLLLILFWFGGFFVGNFFAMVTIIMVFPYELMEIPNIVGNPAAFEHGKTISILFQGISHLFAFTVAPLLLLLWQGWEVGKYLSPQRWVPLTLLLLSGFIFILVMPANSWLIELNANMDLPDFMQGFETWAKEKEDTLRELTQFLTRFESGGEFLFGLVVFALVPAIGEEIVFRGIAQKQFISWTRNVHVGIWVTAIIFGAIHIQFYGFLPRTVLGALFGYLYLWSGNLWVPILGHFINNGFTVLALYLYQQKMVDVEIDSVEAMPWYHVVSSFIVTLLVLFYLRRRFLALRQNPEQIEDAAAEQRF
ncbi:MAG: CPBP family intramembrane metalloprotease [Hymenobacteraceae bacterium]|nr:CPBP family intramembrane metalloprotease [Hymenobacteraceae bacterium]MDX5397277.1 CPBP family intramembrane metalloprotease [Hymenobacteraceae bacterium]MDX5443787.1 CPBP family intramembrane metalloprotease [Hymenobacteraceae bacterium]MDX5513355.1 CPBP family intramembrane metalloprotease [Hymenobacteraceae bacterium]